MPHDHPRPAISRRRRRALLATGVAVAGAIGTAAAVGTTSEITLTGTYDTYDVAFSPDGTRAYATDESSNNISVIDTAAGTAMSRLGNFGGALNTPWGIGATATELYVANSNANNVLVIDRTGGSLTHTIAIPGANASQDNEPKTIAVDARSSRVYVLVQDANMSNTFPPTPAPNGNGRLSVIDTASHSVVGSAPSLSGAINVTLSRDGARAYVSSLVGNIYVIDTATMQTIRTIAVPGGGELAGIAADPRGQHLFVLKISYNNFAKVQAVDLDTGQVASEVTIGISTTGNDVVVSPDGQRAFATSRDGGSSFSGAMTELDTSNPQALAVVGAQPVPVASAYGLGISSDGARVYAAQNVRPTGKVTALTMALPDAPTGATATAGVESATVSWTAPASNGGAPILSYTAATVEDPGKSCTTRADLPSAPATTCTIEGLTAGRSYTVVVTATNGIGAGPASAPGGPVVPPAGPASSSGSSPTSTSSTPSATPNETTSAPSLAVRLLPSRRSLRAGQAMTLGVRTSNGASTSTAMARMRGQMAIATAEGVRTCVRLPANLVLTKRPSGSVRSGRTVCWTSGDIPAGQQRTAVLRVRAVAVRAASRTISASARSTGGSQASTRATARAGVKITPRAPRPVVTG